MNPQSPLFSLRAESFRIRAALIGLVALVFLLSAAICLYYGDGFLLGTYEKLNNDDVKYVRSAELLLSKGVLTYNSGEQPSIFIMPGLPFLIAAFRFFLERTEAVMAFRLFQCALQAASVYLMFVLARQFFGSRAALAAAFLGALYIPSYFSSGVVLTETTFTFLLLLTTLLTVAAVRTKRLGLYAAIGFSWAAMTYFKPQSLLYPAVILLLWLAARYSVREMLKFGAVLAVVFCLLLSPWWVRNYQTFGKPILLTQSSGNPFLLGTFIYYGAPSAKFFEQYPQYRDNLVSDSDAINKQTGMRILRYGFTHEPLRYLSWYTVEKTWQLFWKPFYWKPILGLSKPVVRIWHLLYVFGGIGGILLSIVRRKFAAQLPLFLTMGYFTAVYLPFVAFTRYGYPLMPFLMIYAASGGIALIQRIRLGKGAALSDGSMIAAG